jgi:hypothetical protein
MKLRMVSSVFEQRFKNIRLYTNSSIFLSTTESVDDNADSIKKSVNIPVPSDFKNNNSVNRINNISNSKQSNTNSSSSNSNNVNNGGCNNNNNNNSSSSSSSNNKANLFNPNNKSSTVAKNYNPYRSKNNSSISNLSRASNRSTTGDVNRRALNPSKVLSEISQAKKNKMELTMKNLMDGLRACKEVNDSRTEEAFWIYSTLKSIQPGVPIEGFMHVMRVCAMRSNGDMALRIFQDYKDKYGGTSSLDFTSNLVISLAKSRTHGEQLDQYYAKLRDIAKNPSSKDSNLRDKEEIISQEAYVEVTKGYSRFKRGDDVLKVLNHMTDDGHEPPINLCNYLLDSALYTGDTNVLRLLSSWYLENFNVRLDHGVLNRLLQVASASGDKSLAIYTIQLMKKYEADISVVDFECLIRSSILDNDYVSAIEALIQTNLQGINILTGEHVNHETNTISKVSNKGGLALQELFADRLSRSVNKVDALYFSLVDLVKENSIVPQLALNSIIIASGRMGQLDRSFATFQEYKSLFGLDPDLHSYNALLMAAARSRMPKVNAMLAILQEMENAGVSPNSTSFALLLEVMVETNDLPGFDDIALHVQSLLDDKSSCDELNDKDLVLLMRSLRRVAVTFAKNREWNRVEYIINMMTELGIPRHFSIRLENIKESQNQI